jgi:hypothetical protein
MKRNSKIFILVIFIFINKIGYSQQYPNTLTIENKGLSINEIKYWMYAFGEISEIKNNFTLEELIQKSHLTNKEKPYSIYQFNNYGINVEGLTNIIPFTNNCSDNNAQTIYFNYQSNLFYLDMDYKELANYEFVRILKTQYFGEIVNGKFERLGECKSAENLLEEAAALYVNEVEIYPNPFENTFKIKLAGKGTFTKIEVIAPDGKLIESFIINTEKKEGNEILIDATKWASGIYILKIYSKMNLKYRKTIKH